MKLAKILGYLWDICKSTQKSEFETFDFRSFKNKSCCQYFENSIKLFQIVELFLEAAVPFPLYKQGH